MTDTAYLIDREQALAALRKDRDESGPGVHRFDLGRFPEQTLRELRADGFVIGLAGELYQLGHDEPAPTDGPDDGRTAATPIAAVQSSDPSVDAGQLPLEQTIHIPVQLPPRKARPHYSDA